MGSWREIGVLSPTARAPARAARLATRANAMACRHGAWDSFSARAASRATSRTCSATQAACDGCIGDDSSAGPSASRRAISGGKHAHNRRAAHSSRDRTTSVLT